MSIRAKYNQKGVDQYYADSYDTYLNPHSDFVIECLSHISPTGTVIDFGCGDGLVTKTLMKDKELSFIGIDKYMASRYSSETGFKSLELDFKEVASGLNIESDMVICSYVVDLIPASLLNQVMWSLSHASKKIITIRPNSHRLTCSWLNEIKHVKCGKARLTEYKVM